MEVEEVEESLFLINNNNNKILGIRGGEIGRMFRNTFPSFIARIFFFPFIPYHKYLGRSHHRARHCPRLSGYSFQRALS